MRAIVQTKYGPPTCLQLQDLPKPTPKEDEVLVRVRATCVHPDVWHAVLGRPYILRLMGSGFFRPKNPVPGTDMAGIVESIGAKVEEFKPGDEVFGETIGSTQWSNGGTYAEFAIAPAESLAIKPSEVSFEHAACVPTSGFIALMNLDEIDQSLQNKEVLINGAGGGVGSLALQLAKVRGARVTAVDCAEKQAMLRSLGADATIDYKQEDFTKGSARYDLIFDIPGNHFCNGAANL